ncbi:protein-L-isoaspartate O-methyltransferase [Prauserella oleivorans]|uniref:Protein-L-isoaspartate O-methyltransferase n=1 Tax=Prauserella oleivorans TaxID=1478153 RepID=A0ABW5WGN8_9PSEU
MVDAFPDGMTVDVDVHVDHRYCQIDIASVQHGVRISLGATPATSLNLTLDEQSAEELNALLSTWLTTRPRTTATGRDTAGHGGRPAARRLARRLRRSGALHTTAWWEVVEYTPRHHFIPRILAPRPDGTWTEPTRPGHDMDQWLALVYSDTDHVTDLTESDGQQVPIIGDEHPHRMLGMLEHLHIQDDHTVIEVGAGTGYGTALLHERVGCTHVHTVDIDARRVEAARQRLDLAGYAPILVELVDSLDTIHGGADRLLSHFAVPAIPRNWILPLEGIVITEFAPLGSPGHLVVLHCKGDTAQGHFAPALTPATQPFHQADRSRLSGATPVIESKHPPPWFLIPQLPQCETTPGNLKRFGLTVTPEEHIIWRDDPRSPYQWRLPL